MKNKDFPLIVGFVIVLIAFILGGLYIFLLFNPEKTQVAQKEDVLGAQNNSIISPTPSSIIEPTKLITTTPTEIIVTQIPAEITTNSTNNFKLQINKNFTFAKNSIVKKIIGKTESNAEIRVLNNDKKELQTISADEDGDFDFDVEEKNPGKYNYYFRGSVDKKVSELVVVEVIIN